MMILRGDHDFFLLGFRGAIENFFICGGRYKGGGGPSENQ